MPVVRMLDGAPWGKEGSEELFKDLLNSSQPDKAMPGTMLNMIKPQVYKSPMANTSAFNADGSQKLRCIVLLRMQTNL